MKAHIFLVSILMSFALAGCVVDPQDATDPDPAGGGDPTPSDTPATGGNDSTPPPESLPPDVELAASTSSATAPSEVTFRLTSDSAYATYLDWSFDADGDGVADEEDYGLPAEVVFNYTETGNYTAVVTVTDPEGLTANATLEITIGAPAPPPEPIVFSGTETAVFPASVTNQHAFNVTPQVKRLTITFEVTQGGVDYDFYLLDAAGEEVAKAAAENEPTGLVFPQVEPPIVVEAPAPGAYVLEATAFISVEGGYTATVTFE